jgi:hypothetical protein
LLFMPFIGPLGAGVAPLRLKLGNGMGLPGLAA